jgi:hypothetical protein
MLVTQRPKMMVRGPRKNLRKRQGTARRSASTIPHPPPINGYEVKHNKTLRFTTNVAVSQGITFQNLLDCILFTTSAIAPFDLFFAARIRRIRVWAVPILGTSASVCVVYNSTGTGEVGDRKVHQDSSMGIEPAFISCIPEKNSLTSKFQISNTQVAFFLEAPTGSVVDIDIQYRSDVQGNEPAAAANASVGATVGVVAFRGLDGLAVATSKYTIPTSIYAV